MHILWFFLFVWHQEFKTIIEKGLYCGGTILTKKAKQNFINSRSVYPCIACKHAYEQLSYEDRIIYHNISIADPMDILMGTKNSCVTWK